MQTTHKAHLGNWREHPQSQWAFQHVRSLIPTDEIRASENPLAFSESINSGIDSMPVCVEEGKQLSTWLAQSNVDSVVVLKAGDLAWQWCAAHCDLDQPHIVFSISKSICAMLTGVLVEQGVVDLAKPLPHYLPGLRGGAYEDCTLRHLLDMAVAVDFDENYLDPTEQYLAYRTATGWNPVSEATRLSQDNSLTLESFLYQLKKADYPHSERFSYRSPNTDLLGLVLERAAGESLAALLSRLLWQPMGAHRDGYITVDSAMAPRAAGGICVSVHDLARFGQLVLDGGAVGGRSVIPQAWIDDTISGGDKAAWQKGDFVALLPAGGCT